MFAEPATVVPIKLVALTKLFCAPAPVALRVFVLPCSKLVDVPALPTVLADAATVVPIKFVALTKLLAVPAVNVLVADAFNALLEP